MGNGSDQGGAKRPTAQYSGATGPSSGDRDFAMMATAKISVEEKALLASLARLDLALAEQKLEVQQMQQQLQSPPSTGAGGDVPTLDVCVKGGGGPFQNQHHMQQRQQSSAAVSRSGHQNNKGTEQYQVSENSKLKETSVTSPTRHHSTPGHYSSGGDGGGGMAKKGNCQQTYQKHIQRRRAAAFGAPPNQQGHLRHLRPKDVSGSGDDKNHQEEEERSGGKIHITDMAYLLFD